MKGAGAERGVSFTDTEPNFNDQIDAAYRTKYRRLGGGGAVHRLDGGPEARSTTFKLLPRLSSFYPDESG
jgi:hypothetical protein